MKKSERISFLLCRYPGPVSESFLESEEEYIEFITNGNNKNNSFIVVNIIVWHAST